MEIGHFAGVGAVLTIMVLTGLYSMKKVKSAEDFNKGGGKSSAWMVSGLLLGALIGGQSTIGTAQLAYTHGLSAIWFSFGVGVGTILLGLLFVVPLRRRREVTLLEVLRGEFGEPSEYLGSILCSMGMLVAAVSNVLAASALIMAMTGLPLWAAAVLTVALMCCYVVFGGVLGAEMGGLVKIILLLVTSAVCIAVVFKNTGGPEVLGGSLPLHLSDLFSRGVGKDLSNFASAILGVLSTQTYAQAVWSAKNYHVARKATIISGFVCIPVGFVGVLVGIAMRESGLANPAEAFPAFLLNHLPPLAGGICLGALLITVITGGGGLTLGAATIFVRDILGRIKPELNRGQSHITAMRVTMLVILSCAGLVAVLLPGTFINDLGFLSLGLRGTVIFIPLCLALFAKGKFRQKQVLLSMVAGPCVMLLGNLLWAPVDPLVGSILVCLFICMFGYKGTEAHL